MKNLRSDVKRQREGARSLLLRSRWIGERLLMPASLLLALLVLSAGAVEGEEGRRVPAMCLPDQLQPIEPLTSAAQEGISLALDWTPGVWREAVVRFEQVTRPAAGGPCDPIFSDINPDNSDLDSSDPNGAAGGRINGLASVAGDNQTFYAASEWGGLFKTTDGGLTWQRLDRHLPVAMWDVEVNPGSTSTVFATSFYDGRVAPLSGIEVSYDAGATWAHPASAVPNDPGSEGSVSDNTPQANYSCSTNRRTEPSAFGIGYRPDATQNAFVGTNCGVAISTNSGATWTFVDPTPGASNCPDGSDACNVWDVVVRPGGPNGQGIVDICGDDGHYRSIDGGTTWTGGTGGLPTGRCSIAVSPDESYVLFVAASDNNVYESDDAGATWTNLGNNGPQGRIPFVVTNQRSDSGGDNVFNLWYADTQLYRADCTTPDPPAQGGAARCPNAGSWSNEQSGSHWDGGDVVFDTEAANDACPMLFSNDGGVYYQASGCHDPTWEQPEVVPHAEWLFAMAGAHQPGDTSEDLYFGNQDIGSFASQDAGASTPTWSNRDCCDVFDAVADSSRVLYTVCCSTMGRSNRMYMRGPGMSGGGEINTYPSGGTLPAFRPIDIIAQFGDKKYAMVDTNGVWFTDDITASPIQWTQLGVGPASACGVQAAVESGGPTFYVQAGICNERTMANNGDQLWKYVGTGAGSWTRIDTNLPGATNGIGIFAVDPNNPGRLYASNIRSLANGGPQMVYSNDGGQTWVNDADLDTLMTGGGVFKYSTARGPSNFANFRGYPQPTLVAFDPSNPDLIVAGARDAGVFISRNGGGRWGLLTDPFDSGNSGIPHLPRPWFAYFDHEPAGSGKFSLFIGTQGRGVWRLTLPEEVPVLTVPGDLDVGDTCVGETTHATLYVCNTGSGCDDLIVDSISSSDPQFAVTAPSSGFPVVISSDFCFPFQVTFTPTSPGSKSATLTITSNDPIEPEVTVQVTGTAGVPDVRVTGSSDFGGVCAGALAEKRISVCNVGACNLTVTGADFNPACPDFMLINRWFPAVVSPDFCMELVIRFTPTSAGPKSCTLVIHTDDPDTPDRPVVVTANTPVPSIDVPDPLAFPPTVINSVGACQTPLPFPVSNTGSCNLSITDLSISDNPAEYSILGRPSYPIVLEPGHIAGEGDLQVVFAPDLLDRDELGQVSVTYVSDPITGATTTETRALCGEGVRTGARVLVRAGGVPLPLVESLKIQRINANRNRNLLDTVESARDLPLQAVIPAPPCGPFQYHREYGTVSNPIQLLPGSYQVTAVARVGGKIVRKTVGFDVSTCDFNPTIIVDF